MKPDNLRPYLRATPFKPFELHLENGGVIPVRHPELVSQSPDGWTLILWTSESTHAVVEMDSVTRLEVQHGGGQKSAGKT